MLVIVEADGEFLEEVPIYMYGENVKDTEETVEVVYHNPLVKYDQCKTFGSRQCKESPMVKVNRQSEEMVHSSIEWLENENEKSNEVSEDRVVVVHDKRNGQANMIIPIEIVGSKKVEDGDKRDGRGGEDNRRERVQTEGMENGRSQGCMVELMD